MDSRKEVSEELDRFARKHRLKTRSFDEYEEKTAMVEEELAARVQEDPKMATAYVEWLKSRSKRAATMTALKTKMQKALLSDLWKRIAEKQEETFDRAIASRVLDQSRYEKQIVTKLCEVREQKNIMAENQRILENMTLETNEAEYRASIERQKDLESKMNKDVEIECQRMCELRQRLRAEKIERMKQKHWKICREAAEDLIDLATRIAIYRKENDGHVPRATLREWETLFLKCQPIFDKDVSLEIGDDMEEEDKQDMFEEASRARIEKMEALQEALFDDYCEVNSPWNEYFPMLAEDTRDMFELGRMVLGYIVHRLLNYFRSDPADRARALLPKLNPVAIIVGLTSPTVHETVRALLERSQIRLVRMEEAINFCLERYKNEMADVEYIDLNVITATDETVKELEKYNRRLKSAGMVDGPQSDGGSSRPNKSSKTSKSREEKKKKKKKKTTTTATTTMTMTRKSERSSKNGEEQDPTTQEKETQTPRNIPYDDMDPVLTDSAFIGKWAYEYLTLGEPITNELAAKILVEYLRSLSNATGCALIDYPNTYEEMSVLEEALTGCKLPPNPDSLQFEDVIIEDVEPVSPRIIFEEPVDSSTLYRHSKLVPDPTKRIEDKPRDTFATLFVRVAQKAKNFDIEEPSYEPLNPDSPSIDKFYASRNIAYVLYYSRLDLTTLKRLARLVIGQPFERQLSEELFGNVLESFEHPKERSEGSRAPVVRRLLAEPIEPEFEEESMEREEEEEERNFERDDYQTIEFDLRLARPAEKNWEWLEFPLPPTLAEYLANLWEGLENVYAEALKELLFLKSVHSSGIVSYRTFVTTAATEFIDRPHNMQDLLHDFHKAFNDVDEDARNDVDVKCELHRRVADFQAQLWEICDKRRLEAEEERRRFIDDHWTVFEARVLFNVYVGIIQIEMDRCIDTIRLLQDYYLGMLKKPLQELRFSKVLLHRMEIDDIEFAKLDRETSESLKAVEKGEKGRKEVHDRSKTKGGSSKSAASLPPAVPPLAVEYAVLEKEIDDFLFDRSKPLNDTEGVCIYKTIVENVRYARGIVDGIGALANELLKKEEATGSKRKDELMDIVDPILGKQLASRIQDLLLEWRYAMAYEIERVRLRLDSLVAASRSDIGFLLETMQRTFHQIYDSIVDRYWREMRSVNEMANVFCFAIEEAVPLKREMLLDEDRFIVRSNVYVMEVELKKATMTKETESSSRFRVAQLNRLMEILRRVAPYGVMAERTLVYILQDLASHGFEEGESISLPCCWYRLRSTDISNLVQDLFGSADFVDWRELIIYALDLPMPSHREILIARDRFRIQDPALKEIVTCAQFLRTPLWFLDYTDIFPDSNQFLRDDFQRNIEELYTEELYHFNCDKLNERMEEATTIDLTTNYQTSEDRLRLILAKELLCRMYMISRHTVNYTALLLAFCKDENPREGFAKALALALGNRVCTDPEQGKKYVEELYEQKRLAREARYLRTIPHLETLQVVTETVRHLIDRVERAIDEETLENVNELHHLTLSKVFSSFSEEIGHERISLISSSFSGEERTKYPKADQEFIIYWLPLDVTLAVLAAALPYHDLNQQLLRTSKNLRDSLISIYQELKDDDLNDEKNLVLAHRLLNHNFMKQLLNSTNKFTLKSMKNIIEEILRARENVKSD
ncbi:sperm flagellar protein 2 [Calliopsis andreniformis]|uniref:sperm flagellar protein 2 n=1 Tax=Calliopsis andreniformis TaxID=337506 RepID=UPI003FCC4769